MRDVGTHELIGERNVFASLFVLLHRLDPANDTRKLTSTTSLLLVRVGEVRATGDRFAVRDTRLASCTLNVVLTAHALDIDLEVQLTHARNDGLLALRVDVHAERRVLAPEAIQGTREVGRLLTDRLQSKGDDGFRNEHRRL